MYYLQGFAKLLPYVDNNPDVVAPVGELSDHAATYAKDKGLYTDSTKYPGVEFVSFYSDNAGVRVDVPERVSGTILRIAQFIVNRAQVGSSPDNAEAFRQLINNEFQGSVKGLAVGSVVRYNNQYFPTWIEFEASEYSTQNTVKVWFTDETFRDQYQHFEIQVVQPIDNLDDFFNDPLDVKALLDRYSLSDKIQQVNASRGKYPFSYLASKDYNYTDPRSKDYTLQTHWLVLIWGANGNNQDAIKAAIQKHILTHSKQNQDKWASIFPDLFLSTEHVIVPLWNKYSIANREIQGGIYSPSINPDADNATVRKFVKGAKYTPQWIAQNTEFSHNIYKSLSFASVGHPDNRDGIVRFSEKFPDYFVVTNDSPDFNRMSQRTQAFVVKFARALKLAEETTDTSSLDVDFPRITRDDVIYVSFLYENVTYLVATKYSVTK